MVHNYPKVPLNGRQNLPKYEGLPLRQEDMLNNQSVIIQNIIIGNYHNDQRIQISSNPLNDKDSQERPKKKRKKSKRKSSQFKEIITQPSNYSGMKDNRSNIFLNNIMNLEEQKNTKLNPY